VDVLNTLSQTWQYILDPKNEFPKLFATHLELSLGALFAAIAVGVPLGILISRYGGLSQVVVNTAGIVRVIPSLAVLFLLLPWLHTGFRPAVVALTLLAIPPLLINTNTGLRGVDKDIVEAGRGMGMSNWRLLGRVQVPLAMPVMIAGLRIATVEVIASATLASLIGAGGLGDYIATGLSLSRNDILLAGAIPVAMIALVAELSLSALQRRLQRREVGA